MKIIFIGLLVFSQVVLAQTNFNSSLNVNYGDGSMYNYNVLGPSVEEDYNYSQTLYRFGNLKES